MYIKRLCKKKGITVDYLAKKELNMTYQNLRNSITKGTLKFCSMVIICKVLGVSFNELAEALRNEIELSDSKPSFIQRVAKKVVVIKSDIKFTTPTEESYNGDKDHRNYDHLDL